MAASVTANAVTPLSPMPTHHFGVVERDHHTVREEPLSKAGFPELSDLKALSSELSAALEITLSDADLESVRTREDLVALVMREIGKRDAFAADPENPPMLHVRIAAKGGPDRWYLERSLPWTPYALETIWDDAVHAGHGCVVDVTMPQGTPRKSIIGLEQRFAPLRYRGVRVRVRTVPAVDHRSC
jgi:hypothetical protein